MKARLVLASAAVGLAVAVGAGGGVPARAGDGAEGPEAAAAGAPVPTPVAASAPSVAAPAAAADDVVAGELIVDLRDDVDTDEEIAALEKDDGVDLAANSIWSGGAMVMRAHFTDPLAEAAAAARLAADPRVESVEMDHLYGLPPFPVEHAFATEDEAHAAAAAPGAAPAEGFPNDPLFKFQWHLDQIGMRNAWPLAVGTGVIVAVIDTGVAYEDFEGFKRVPDLAGVELVPGYDFVGDDEHANDDHGHGTHVTGTIAQATNNALGVAGIAFGAKIMPLKVLNASGMGNTADIADAIRFAADHGAKVINMSLGGPYPSKVMRDAVAYAWKKGVLVVCAAGNDGRGKVGYPAAYEHALAVSATQFDEKITFYSNWGKDIDIAAPGGNTQLDQNGDGKPDGVLQNTIIAGHPDRDDYLLFMGTSMASPHVAGVAAAVMSLGVTDPDAAASVLFDTARDKGEKGWDDHYGHGIVDASAATRAAAATGARAGGAWKLGLALLLGLAMTTALRRKHLADTKPNAWFWTALAVGASGVAFTLPLFGVHLPGVSATLLGQGLPAWDLLVFGAGSHANPLFYSALLPLLLVGLGGGVQSLRAPIAGLSIGIAAHLMMAAVGRPADVTFIPGGAIGDGVWLLANAAIALGLAWLIQRKK
ncbi:MAG TPA: S8 family peptidase [Myxococcota bacterium]|jgi:serine protease|nr:S8 family peptidase [Myxococcota bacterium]